MKKILRRFLLILVLVIAAIQVIRPARTNPAIDPAREITAMHQMSPSVTSVLQRSCNDCHSNRTVWPWYSNVAPASWLVVHDVNSGRQALNFSDWKQPTGEDGGELLAKICEEVNDREMPPLQYTLLHPQAKLSSSDMQTVCSWTRTLTGATSRAERDDD